MENNEELQIQEREPYCFNNHESQCSASAAWKLQRSILETCNTMLNRLLKRTQADHVNDFIEGDQSRKKIIQLRLNIGDRERKSRVPSINIQAYPPTRYQ
jgi:hypothetical protein